MHNIAAIIPAHNEADTISGTIQSLQTQGITDITVIADNCTDDTAEVALTNSVKVLITKGNLDRKSGALNFALSELGSRPIAPHLVLAVDGDTVLHEGWVRAALGSLEKPSVGAVGAIFEADSTTGFLRRCQALEWYRFAEQANRTGKTFVLSGTAAIIRWEVIEQVRAREGNVYNPNAITEDFDFSVRILREGWSLSSPDKCRTTTETMPTWLDLFRQRRRWSLGAMQVVTRHGLHSYTKVYWVQQAMLLLSILAMGMLMTVTAVSLWSGSLTFSLFWILVGFIFVSERVVTVWDLPLRERVFAALILPELFYAIVLQTAHVAALCQFLTGSSGSWSHVTK